MDQHITFWKLPVVLGLAYLEIRRGLHQKYNLLDVPEAADAENQDLKKTAIDPLFGRNMPSDYERSEVYFVKSPKLLHWLIANLHAFVGIWI